MFLSGINFKTTPTSGGVFLASLWRLGASNQSGGCSKLPLLKLQLRAVASGKEGDFSGYVIQGDSGGSCEVPTGSEDGSFGHG